MQLFVGLGNPGDKYQRNRHNIGFMAADAIAHHHGFPAFRQKFSGLVSEGAIAGERVVLLKPQTYMNASGDSVGAAARFYKLDPADVTVFYDEIDLVPGKLRVKIGGGSGGHNGIRSIDPAIGQEYRRVRLGVGHPGHKDAVMPHVLGDFSRVDHAWLDPMLAAVAANAELLVRRDDNTFMNRVAIAVSGDGALRDERPHTADPTRPKRQPQAQSHIRAARQPAPAARVPETGPLAEMLKKLFDKK